MQKTGVSQNKNFRRTKSHGFTAMIGDAIEKVGLFVQRAGARDLGRKIYQMGDRLEHRDDVVTKTH